MLHSLYQPCAEWRSDVRLFTKLSRLSYRNESLTAFRKFWVLGVCVLSEEVILC